MWKKIVNAGLRAPELRHAVVVEKEVLRAGLRGGGCFRNVAVYFISNPPPGPGCPLSPWGGMVRRFSQGHRDGQTFMTQELSESSLTPPSSGTSVFAIRMRPHEGTKKVTCTKRSNLRTPRKRVCLNLVLLLLLLNGNIILKE